jgi:hypothetical protein
MAKGGKGLLARMFGRTSDKPDEMNAPPTRSEPRKTAAETPAAPAAPPPKPPPSQPFPSAAVAPQPASPPPDRPSGPPPSAPETQPAPPMPPTPPSVPGAERLALAANEIYRAHILEAAARTGVDPAALAALISAEAAVRNGVWDAMSKAVSSSASGLTQFLDASWIEQAERPGTLLHEEARRLELLDDRGKVPPAASGPVLALRFNPRFAIVAAAEYGKQNLEYLAGQGITARDDDERARLMYIAHHEGPGGARKVLDGSLDEARASRLLPIQVGVARAAQLQSQHGSAKAAYIAWLNEYAASKIQPGRFRV